MLKRIHERVEYIDCSKQQCVSQKRGEIVVIDGMKHIRDQPLILFGIIICFLFVLITKIIFIFLVAKSVKFLCISNNQNANGKEMNVLRVGENKATIVESYQLVGMQLVSPDRQEHCSIIVEGDNYFLYKNNSKNQLTKINWFKEYLKIFSFKADFLFYVLKKEQASLSVVETLRERIKEIGLLQQFEKEKCEEESENSVDNNIEIREKEEEKEKLFDMDVGNEEENESGVGMHLGQVGNEESENGVAMDVGNEESEDRVGMDLGNEEENEDGVGMHLGQQESEENESGVGVDLGQVGNEESENGIAMDLGNEEENEDGFGMHLGQQESENDEIIEMQENLNNEQVTPKKSLVEQEPTPHPTVDPKKSFSRENLSNISINLSNILDAPTNEIVSSLKNNSDEIGDNESVSPLASPIYKKIEVNQEMFNPINLYESEEGEAKESSDENVNSEKKRKSVEAPNVEKLKKKRINDQDLQDKTNLHDMIDLEKKGKIF